jgi:hypothetical protein
MRLPVALALWLLLFAPAFAAAVPKPRVIVLANISSFNREKGDPDSAQSLLRLLLYSNALDLEVLVASSALSQGQKVRPELLKASIGAFGKVRPNLLVHIADYPSAERLLRIVKNGQPFAGPEVRVNDSIGRTHDTEASEAIIEAGDAPDPRPIWVCAFGGTADIAQALWKVRANRTEGDMLTFVQKFRIHAIGDQDSTGPWLRENFPTVRFVKREKGYRGMYQGGDLSLVSSDWLREHVRTKHGFFGENYPDYQDAPLGPLLGIRESASPTFLSLVANGLNEPERVGLSSWGGRLEGPEMRPIEGRDDGGAAGETEPTLASVYRWRRAVQADLQVRLDWCVKPYRQANHAPDARIAGEAKRTIKPGESVELDASASSDPDANNLTFEWLIDLPVAEAQGWKIEGADSARARLTIPAETQATELPILLIVRDNGEPALEAYARAEIAIVR